MKITSRAKRRLSLILGGIIHKMGIKPRYMEATHFVNDELCACSRQSENCWPVRALWEYCCKYADQKGIDVREISRSTRPVYSPEFDILRMRGYRELIDRKKGAA